MKNKMMQIIFTAIFFFLIVTSSIASSYEMKGGGGYNTGSPSIQLPLNYPVKKDTSSYPGYSADKADDFLQKARQNQTSSGVKTHQNSSSLQYNHPSVYQSSGQERSPSGVY